MPCAMESTEGTPAQRDAASRKQLQQAHSRDCSEDLVLAPRITPRRQTRGIALIISARLSSSRASTSEAISQSTRSDCRAAFAATSESSKRVAFVTYDRSVQQYLDSFTSGACTEIPGSSRSLSQIILSSPPTRP